MDDQTRRHGDPDERVPSEAGADPSGTGADRPAHVHKIQDVERNPPLTATAGAPAGPPPPRDGFWGRLTEHEQNALLAIAEPAIYPVGTVLWSEGQTADQAVVIQSGSVRVSVRRDGHERIIAFRGPGD